MLKLKWSEAKKQQLMSAIQYNRKNAKYGVSCIYFALSKTVGVKLYSSEKERDKTYAKQVHAAKYGLAPVAGDCFSFDCFWVGHVCFDNPDIRYTVVYGYLTQNAVLPARTCDYSPFKPLEDKLRQIGLVNEDLHDENVGYIGKRLVCIDFDWCSCKWKAGRKKKVKDA